MDRLDTCVVQWLHKHGRVAYSKATSARGTREAQVAGQDDEPSFDCVVFTM